MRTLVLLRHGKSAYPDDVEDWARPLSDRGHREAPVAGRHIAELAERSRTGIDLALVSSARRAQQTWEHVERSVHVRHVTIENDLYLAGQADLLAMVRALPEAASLVLVVGHNDGLQELAVALSGTPVTMKTSTLAVLTSNVQWSAWSKGCATLDDLVVAR